MIKKIIGAFIGLIALILFFGCFTVVSSQERGVITRMGAINRVVEEGLNFKMPLIEKVTKVNISEQKTEASPVVYTKDGQVVTTKLTVNYQVNHGSVESLFRDTRNNYENIIISPVLSPVVEEIFSKYTAQEVLDRRSSISPEIKGSVVSRVGDRGINIKNVEFTFDFDDQYEAAIRNKQVQEQNALAQVNVTKQEDEKKKQEILKAEALSEKTRLEAVALASSQGEKVIEKIYAEAALEAAKKWNGVMPTQMVPGSALPFINVGNK